MGALALTCSHTLALSQLMHAPEVPRSQQDLQAQRGRHPVTEFSNLHGMGGGSFGVEKEAGERSFLPLLRLPPAQFCALMTPLCASGTFNTCIVTRIKQNA